MCGIAGIFGPGADAQTGERMRDSVAHRGPDGFGIFAREGVVLGHRRLSIIDTTDQAKQPMTTADGRYTVVFNGEVYNYRELKKELGGDDWQSTSDTEVLLRAFAKWGIAAVDRFNGMFAFAIYDAKERVLTCVRDRLGIKPFYYAFHQGTFYFGSEIKVLLAAGIPAVTEDSMVVDYLAYGMYDHTDLTFFKGIRKLPPGCYVELRQGEEPQPKRYWDLQKRAMATEVPTDEREVIQRYTDLFQDALALRLRSDVPIGVTLSSGLDSTGLMAHLRRVTPEAERLHAFSACYREEKYDEGRQIQELIGLFGNPWHQSYVEAKDVPALSEQVLEFQDEPYGGIPQLGFYRLHEQARASGVTVLLEGHGVEEYLTGYAMYFPPYWTDLFARGKFIELSREIRGFAQVQGKTYASVFESWYGYVRHTRGTHLDLTRQSFSSVLDPGYMKAHQRLTETPEPFTDRLKNVLFHNLSQSKLPRVLRFQDRISMAFGRELRLPYLDYRLVEYGYALPGRYKIREGRDKWILRKSLEGLVPPERLTIKKNYVVTPQTHWLQYELKDFVLDIVGSASFRGRSCFNQAAIKERLQAFYADPDPKNSFFVWQLVNLEQWFRRYIDA